MDISSINGILNKNVTVIDENVIYTLTAFNDGILTVSYNDINISKTFEFLKSNPSISLTTNDIMFGDNLTVTVTAPGDAEGDLTVNVGNVSQTKAIESTKTIFIFENLKADNYTITLTYSGDKKYISKELTSNVIVNKYESTIKLNISTVNVGEDVILTITITDSSTGNVTLKINNDVQTLILNNSKASYTIKNIIRGDYLITAIYNGDDKYLSSQDSKFIEVDNLNATISITLDDIVYGDTALVQVTLNDNATGSVSATVDGMTNTSDVKDGKSIIKLNNLEAGIKDVIVFYTGDDTYFNKTLHANFTINKAELTFEMSSGDVMIGQDAHVYIKVPAKTKGTFTIGEDIITIPITGSIDYVIYDLGIGNYTYTAIYNGNNYNTVSNTTSFEVKEYSTPQWASEGGNTQNTQKSPYETLTNGEIAFVIPFNLTLSGDLVVDSLGNVYLPTQDGIYAFNQTRQLWYFTSTDAIGNLSGIAISRDVIIAPKSGDTLYFINQTTGEKYGSSNIYQGSSLFAPVVTSDATLYIVSEYQYSSEDYKLTIIPYRLWENGGDPTLVTIGNTQPLCAPTLNDNLIVIVSDNRLRMIDAKTLQTISIKSANFQPVRPVIGEGNIVYAVLSDSVVAYSSNGVQLWKTKVSGGVGSTLVLDNEQGLYHVNSRGVLYKYDLVDGSQSKFSSLKVTSGVLIDANNNLYFGSNSIFYALDSEGNILWKSDLGSKIIGNPVMDASGLIYIPTKNGVAALTYAPLSNPDLKVGVDDVVEGDKATFTITWNNQTTGNVSYNVNGEDITVNAEDAKITKVISGLTAGYYDITVSYSGDMRFKESSITKTFVVRSTDDVANNIQFDGNQTFTFSLTNARGNLTVNVAGKTYSNELINGQTSIIIDKLSPGDYEAIVTYSGDRQYNKANRTFSIEIPKFNVELNEVIVTENVVSRISVSLPNDATGNLTLSVGTKKYTQTVNKGNAVIIVDDLPEGNYSATLTYSGDDNYESVSKPVSINPTRIPVTLDDSNVFVESGADVKVSIKLNANATGRFTVSIDGEEYSADISEELIISGLEPGNYTGTLTYSGDFRFSKASKELQFEVPKIVLQFNDSNLFISKLDDGIMVNVTLPSDARGDIILSVNGTNYTGKLTGGVSSVKVTGLIPENYHATVTYSGSDKYEAISRDFVFSIGKVEVSFNDTTLSVISPSHQPVVNVVFDKAVTGNITVTVNGRQFLKELINGSASVEITGLSPGNYSATVAYSGDVKYGATEKTIQLEVPKITVALDNLVVKSNVTVPVISVMLPSDATGNLIVNVTGNVYTGKIINGNCSVEIIGLTPGNYTALVSYSGDNNYTDANKTVNIEVPKIIIILNDDNCMWNASQVSVNLNNATGTLTVEIAGKTYTKELINGNAAVDIIGLDPGSYDVRIIYSGDNVYTKAEKTTTLEIPKLKVVFDDDTLTVNSTNVNVNLPEDVTGNITVVVSGKSFTKELIGGKATVNVDDLAPSSYNATITYSGDGKYESVTKTVVVNVKGSGDDKADPVLIISVDDIDVGDGAVVNVKTSVESGKVVVNVNKVDYELVVSNGEASVTVSDLAAGSYVVTATFAGNDKFNEAINSTTFSVSRVDVPITNETITLPESDSTKYSISLPSDATGTLTVSVDDKNYTETLANGKATVNIPELTEGSHNITVTYSGDGKYSPIVRRAVVVKEHVPVIKLTGSNLNMLYSSGKYFKVRLTSDGKALAGKSVKITINGKTYSRTTDKNGYASMKITLAPKTYNVNAAYGNLAIAKKVTVKSIISAKNVNAKKSAKSVKVKVTLKKVNKKYLKNKKVTLKFNKKTFKAKTNKKGVATFTIKNSVYKKLKTNKKYAYQVIYGKDKVKKTIKFKK